MPKIQISPSILSCDFAYLAEELKDITKAGADNIHIDVMDGHFVPNITLGPTIIKAMRPHSDLPFDVHLMIDNVEKYIKAFVEAGSDMITFHVEAVQNKTNIISLIRSFGKKVGVSIKPAAPSVAIREIIDLVDSVLVMTVEPGFGGQVFMDSQLSKIQEIRQMINSINANIDLAVDGGINDRTAKLVIDAGANVLVAGAYIFAGKTQYAQRIAKLRS